MRYRRVSKDLNHDAIVKELLTAGCSVHDCSMVGDGFPDIAVGMYGLTYLVEIKSEKRIHKQKGDGRKKNQIDFANTWKGTPVIVATNTEQVLKKIMQIAKKSVDNGK